MIIDLRDNKIRLIILSIAIIIFAIIYYNLNLKLQVTHYEVVNSKIPNKFNNFKILQLSDYHGGIAGVSNNTLIKEINKINPDIIVLTGDMIDESKAGEERIIKVLRELVDKYPIYSISGNHEQISDLLNSYKYRVYIDTLNNIGVKVINDKKIEIKKDGDKINLYGVEIPLDHGSALYIDEKFVTIRNLTKPLGELNKKEFNILLAHNPLFIDTYSEWGADLVLSGHLHGGIIRLPFLGGVFSADRKFFPKYDGGEYDVNNTKLIVNRGLGSSSIGVRILNRPDISVITLNKVMF